MGKITILAMVALALSSVAPSFGQNSPSVKLDGSNAFVIVGSLGEAAEAIADDAWLPYPVISLYDPVDVFCSSVSSSTCVASQDISEFRLDIPESLQWIYRQNIDSAVSLTASVGGSSDGVLTLFVTDLSPVTVSTGLKSGLYVKDKRYCQETDRRADEFSEVVVSDEGEIRLSAVESNCSAISVQNRAGAKDVTWGCFSEGYAYSDQFSLNVLSNETFEFAGLGAVADRYSLCSVEDQFPYDPETRDLVVDLRRAHADEISYGSRIGMNAALVQLSDVDTDHARLVAEIMPVNAYEFCAFYHGKFEAECINKELKVEIAEASIADCTTGEFTNIWGDRRRFVGLSAAETSTDFALIDLETGGNVDGSMASGYHTDVEMFATFCPTTVAELLNQPKARPKLSLEAYPAAFNELQSWQGRTIGARNADQRQLADLPIWQFATRTRSPIAQTMLDLLKPARLVMTGHFGFAYVASSDSAALLIDFAQQEIYLCVRRQSGTQPVSYRFGTPLARGIDGFGSKCPDTLSAALREYLPLVWSDQEVVSAYDETNFSAPFDVGEQADFLGLGRVLSENACPEFLEETDPRRWWYEFSGNWYYQGNLGALICRIEGAVYSPVDDTVEIMEACGGSGWDFGVEEWSVPRPPINENSAYFWGDVPMKHCSADFMTPRQNGPQPREFPPAEIIDKRNSMEDWGDVSSGAIYQVGEYSFSFFVDADMGDSAQVLNIAVSRKGSPTTNITLPTAVGGSGAFGVYQMGEPAAPTLVIASYGGGAHCCTEYAFLPLTQEPSNVSFAGSFDADYWHLWDIDRNGSFELARPDIRFSESLGPYLHIWAPPVVYAMEGGTITDVTSLSQYQSYVREKGLAASQYCGTSGNWEVGACQGWAATALRLGEYDETMSNIAKRFAVAPKDSSMGMTTFTTFAREIQVLFESVGRLGVPDTREQAMLTMPAFDDLTCSFRITRRVIRSDNYGELASGTFEIEHGRVINMDGSWTTLGPVVGEPFEGADLTFGNDGGLHGNLTVYPLFVQSEAEIPPSFVASLDGSSTTSVDGGPEGETTFFVDFQKIEISATVFDCSISN